MICPSCKQLTSRVRFYKGRAICAREMGVSEAAGFKVDGIMTRSADRIREQQLRHEGDLIPPHILDHTKREPVPNPDFLKLYPERITDIYTQEELEKAGHSKIGDLFEKDEAERAAHRAELDSITYSDTPLDGQHVDELIAGIGEAEAA